MFARALTRPSSVVLATLLTSTTGAVLLQNYELFSRPTPKMECHRFRDVNVDQDKASAPMMMMMPSKNVAFCDDSLPFQELKPHGIPGTVYERSFIAIKPDGVQRGKIGQIIQRFEEKGFKLVGLKMVWPSKAQAQGHYADLADKPFFGGLVNFFSSGPIVCMVWEGKDAIKTGRRMLGETDPLKSAPGSIRGDFGIDLGRNIIHGSDSPNAAELEINYWFRAEEISNWQQSNMKWVYEV